MIRAEGYRRVADELRREIEDFLNSVGFLCRVFGRGKALSSLQQKLFKSPGKYVAGGKLIQDAVGIRVVLYFPEDISIVEEILKEKYVCDHGSSTIDAPKTNVFSVTRHNLIFKVPERLARDMVLAASEQPIDLTFEVQIRTILSEGWHEVEHDLRYKRLEDWTGHDDLSRGLNGVVATLETAEWSMRTIFEELAYRHYRARYWEGMLHAALRMRVAPTLSRDICDILDNDRDAAKGLLRINRAILFRALAGFSPKIPVTLDNVVYYWAFINKHKRLENLIPQILVETFGA